MRLLRADQVIEARAFRPLPLGSRHAGRDWRATFYVTGIAHSIVGGSAWEPTPRRAVQRAAHEARSRPERRQV
jgi:hypothetical protein